MEVLHHLAFVGRRYEDTYGGWLEMFHKVAEAPNDTYRVIVPPAWEPLMWYLGADVEGWSAEASTPGAAKRHEVELSCAAAPVLVDALWRADMVWGGDRRHLWETEFPVATYSAFFRPEVLKYLRKDLPAWVPKHALVVLVPCAADKPYPSPMHRKVREVVGEGYDIIVATGVLGLVPEDLWGSMPYYDSGVPNEARLTQVVTDRFTAWKDYKRIVVYSDFYARAISLGLRNTPYEYGSVPLCYPLGNYARTEYSDLMGEESLGLLRMMC